ncbi:MAG: GNAT family N-acetyltransferase [Myxococcales bacterium]|nr:GNAT family N-acetyltransferase [Myxococcales bacterium]
MGFSFERDDFRVLSAKTHEDRVRWIELWTQWPQREVQAHPAYVDMFCGQDEHALALSFSRNGMSVLLPVVARPLSAISWTQPSDSRWDLITPYGYGGPYVWGQKVDKVCPEFWKATDDWAHGHQIIGLTARLSLFEDDLLEFHGETRQPMRNVVRDLRLSSEDLWKDYSGKVRKNVKRARKNGLRVVVDEVGAHLDEFLEIYLATMVRCEAGQGFHFSREFFEGVCNDLSGQFAFFHVFLEKKIVSTELVLLSANVMYSFLGGTLSEYFPTRPNDLLKHEAIEWGRERGFHWFVLGGGYGEEDGIYRYKLAFAPSGARSFTVGYHSFSRSDEKKLEEECRRHFLQEGTEWHPRNNFFPSYRS